MRALLDINVLIALLDRDHTLHRRAQAWFAEHVATGWASCPLTQNGCVRIMSSPRYPNPVPTVDVCARLRQATETDLHEFWPDAISVLDPEVIDPAYIHGPRQITDVYLLALAVSRRGTFVTFDQGIAHNAVRSAAATSLTVI